jgi:hypothetical protein
MFEVGKYYKHKLPWYQYVIKVNSVVEDCVVGSCIECDVLHVDLKIYNPSYGHLYKNSLLSKTIFNEFEEITQEEWVIARLSHGI